MKKRNRSTAVRIGAVLVAVAFAAMLAACAAILVWRQLPLTPEDQLTPRSQLRRLLGGEHVVDGVEHQDHLPRAGRAERWVDKTRTLACVSHRVA